MKNLLDPGTKCLIVQSKFSDLSFWNYVEVCEIVGAKYPAAPLGLMTVAALLPQQWDFRLVDENVEPLDSHHFEWADVVCVGGMLPQQKRMLSIIDEAHGYGLPVIVGGPDPSSQPALYGSADYLVRGEGEVTIPMLVEDLGRSAVAGEYVSEDRADMGRAVIPRFDLVNFRNYLQVGIQYTRGCPFNCEFCDIIELYGRKSRNKTPEHVIAELQALYDAGYRGHVDFVDDNFIGNKKGVRELLPALKTWSVEHGYPFFFSTEASMNLADDDDLMQAMRDVDFRFVFLGIESPEDHILESIHKKQNMRRPISEAVKKINSYGMIVNAGFIMGFDNESVRTAEGMIACVEDSSICMAMVGKLYALPNTQLTRRLRTEGRLWEAEERFGDDVDQMTTGLNFDTVRPRLDILRDYRSVIGALYDPARYYARVTETGLALRPVRRHKSGARGMLRSAKSFLKLSKRVGFNRSTGWLYWKLLFTMLARNWRATEAAVSLAAMYVHFQRTSAHILGVTDLEVEWLEQGSHAFGLNASSRRPGRERVPVAGAPVGVAAAQLQV
jgi:radical SAM superfamily enzyme YgiQ (UPF0313 family)